MDLKLVLYGNKVLRKKADPVLLIDDDLKELSDSMHKIILRENGYGLAAPQIGQSIRIIVVDMHDNFGKRVYINPVVTKKSEHISSFNEGCLSIPNVFAPVKRHTSVTVECVDLSGLKSEIKATGLLSAVLQHEIDHLNGCLFIDRIDSKKRKSLNQALYRIKSRGKGNGNGL